MSLSFREGGKPPNLRLVQIHGGRGRRLGGRRALLLVGERLDTHVIFQFTGPAKAFHLRHAGVRVILHAHPSAPWRGRTGRSHYTDRPAVTAKSFVQQENLALVQLDDGVLVQRKLTQPPEGIGSGPGDAEEIKHHHVHSSFAILLGFYAIAG